MEISYALLGTIALIIIFETLAQYFLQRSVKHKNDITLIVGMIVYAIVGFIYYKILKDKTKLAIANSLWNAGTALSITILGYLIFDQKITLKQGIGIFMVTTGALLL